MQKVGLTPKKNLFGKYSQSEYRQLLWGFFVGFFFGMCFNKC